LADAIKAAHASVEVELVPGGKGEFIVTSDGKQIWNKKQMDDEFPEEPFILKRLRELGA
jgi:predicted Rdx family selenoprotein